MAVLVTDGNQRSTLALVRSLGRAGIEVCVGECEKSSLAGASRYCSERICYPSLFDGPGAFLAFIRAKLETGRYAMLIPTTDMTLQAIMQGRDTFPVSVRIPFPRCEQVSLAQDKRSVIALAGRLGISLPKDYSCSADRIEEIARTLSYPVVLKPRFSRLFQDGRWVQGPVRYARDPAAFVSVYRDIDALIPGPIVQEKLEGEGRGVFLLIWDGELKAAFGHRRLREKPPWGGVSVLCESVSLDEELLQKSVALLKAIGWQGVAMVEFKVDRRDGKPKLMEVNGRFWGSLQLPIDAGMDFPLKLYKLAMGEKVSSQFEYRTGVKSRWFLGDLDHLLIRLTHSGIANGLPRDAPSRLRACLNFLSVGQHDVRGEVWRRDDPGPGWFEYRSYFRENMRSIFRGREGHHAR